MAAAAAAQRAVVDLGGGGARILEQQQQQPWSGPLGSRRGQVERPDRPRGERMKEITFWLFNTRDDTL